MTKLLKKNKRSNKKYSKKGGLFFTRTSKYRDMKSERASLQDETDRLELKLENYNTEILQLYEDLENCHKRYKPNPSDYPDDEEDRIFNDNKQTWHIYDDTTPISN